MTPVLRRAQQLQRQGPMRSAEGADGGAVGEGLDMDGPCPISIHGNIIRL